MVGPARIDVVVELVQDDEGTRLRVIGHSCDSAQSIKLALDAPRRFVVPQQVEDLRLVAAIASAMGNATMEGGGR